VVDHAVAAPWTVAVDSLDAVAVGVAQERGVVVGRVPWARAWRAVVEVPRVDARLPERADLLA
jgi:hypothetical protein